MKIGHKLQSPCNFALFLFFRKFYQKSQSILFYLISRPMKMAKVRNDTKIHKVYFLRTKHGKQCVQKREKCVSPDIMRGNNRNVVI